MGRGNKGEVPSAFPLTRQRLDEVAAGTEKSIRDTPAWKDMVRRMRLKEARRTLRLGLLGARLPESNAGN